MSQVQWITPAGNLGTIPELEYYQFPLDAYDQSGGSIVFSKIAGKLPLGIQLNVAAGQLQGIPISELGADQNVDYRFTIRAKNTATGEIADRTFGLTVTNITPPIIVNKVVPERYLGLYLDGTEVNLQLSAVESTPHAELVWSLKSGEIPPGLTLTNTGLISGYIRPVPAVGPGSMPGWDRTSWDLLDWEFDLKAVSKQFTFTIQVTDGVNYDTATYRLQVFPRSALTIDNNTLPIDTTTFLGGGGLTVDYGNKHNPIILTTQDDLVEVRQGSYFSFQIQAIDIDDDVIYYSVPVAATGAFDEQEIIGDSIPYIVASPIGANLYAGISSITDSGTVSTYKSGDFVTLLNDNNVWTDYQITTWATIELISTTKNIIASPGDFIYQQSANANATVNSVVTTTSGNLSIQGTAYTIEIGEYLTQPSTGANITVTNIYSAANLTLSSAISVDVGSTIGQIGNQVSATILANVESQNSVTLTINYGNFNLGNGNLIINGETTTAIPLSVTTISDTVNIGGIYNSLVDFTIGSGNLAINGTNIAAYPAGSTLTSKSTVGVSYTSTNTFKFNNPYAVISISGDTTANAYPSKLISIGVSNYATSVEGTIGFDEGKFDQGALTLPGSITMVNDTGWMIGTLPTQAENEKTYQFEVVAYKRDDPSYRDSQLYTLTVLGDLNNRIIWNTPSDIGTIQNGKISDLYISAVSTKGKQLQYRLKTGVLNRLPQGLSISDRGFIVGRVSFEVFSLDSGTTTIDNRTTTFDNTYTFTVIASDRDNTVVSSKTFTLTVIVANVQPYENLYLKALPSIDQRTTFTNLMQDTSIFPPDLIYRNDDPNFGLADDLRFLFLPGLEATQLSDYANAIANNHFKKTILLGDVKTARALDSNFNVKYEVVYLEVIDTESNSLGQGNELQYQDLSGLIQNPYLDTDGAYTVMRTNAFNNMEADILDNINYANKGALPDWMTSRQSNNRVLGFTRAVVLAYTVPGASELIAYRLKEEDFKFNQFDFTVDRYQLDNIYSKNYDIVNQKFISAEETTFDRYPGLSSIFTDVGYVDYALNTPYEEIHKKSLAYIRSRGGLDGVKNFRDGEYLVFAQQEFTELGSGIAEYNKGWTNVQTIWDEVPWDYDVTVYDLVNPVEWDQAEYVPGYNEHNLDSSVPNSRAGVWQINISSDDIVTLSFVRSVNYYDKLFVKNGFTYGRVNIYYDPIIKDNNLLPRYSIIPEVINIDTATIFDSNGTRFLSNRDSYVVPEQGDKYIKFAKSGVFK